MSEHKLSVTLKGKKANDPWVVVYADSPQELQSILIALQQGAVFAELGKAQTMFTAASALGSELGASHVDLQVGPQPVAPETAPVVQDSAFPGAAPEPVVPGAPLVLGQPANLRNGVTDGRSWQAWADPRSMAELNQLAAAKGSELEYTDDNNHPGLQAGTHQYWTFFR